MVTVWRPGTKPDGTDQVNWPLVASMAAPDGAPGARLNVSVFGGRSGSEATVVNRIVLPALVICGPIGVSDGGRFTSLTVTVNRFVAKSCGWPLSVTRTVIGYAPGP